VLIKLISGIILLPFFRNMFHSQSYNTPETFFSKSFYLHHIEKKRICFTVSFVHGRSERENAISADFPQLAP